MRAFSEKLKEVSYSVLPITLIVIIVKLIPGALSAALFSEFIVGAVAVITGLSVFLYGVSIAITPLGGHIGSAMAKSGNVYLIFAICLIIGFAVNIAEPDLEILASQVSWVTSGQIRATALLLTVSAGIAVMLAVGFIRYIYNIPLNKILIGAYGIILILSLLTPKEFLGIAFDSSGATTGALTVPFLLALMLGASSLKANGKSRDADSFGLIAVASAGAVIAVLFMGVFRKFQGLTASFPGKDETVSHVNAILPFVHALPDAFLQSLFAIAPICVIFIIFQIFVFHVNRREFFRMLKGLLYTLAGLSLFLTGVNAGFMEAGATLGAWIAGSGSILFLAGFGLLLGIVTVLAEPAVHVLTMQIEEVTAGYINRKAVKAALSIGVGLAVSLSAVRILTPRIELWYYLLPGYIIAFVLSFLSPKLFVGIGFDSGGVASGPMTATFILSFTQGVAENTASAGVLRDAFGMIAMVALMPVLTIEILGLLYRVKVKS